MLIRSVCALATAGILTVALHAAEIDAEARKDAGTDYRSAVRIHVTEEVQNPKGRAAAWHGSVGPDDTVDVFKLSPSPLRGQAIMLAAESEGNIKITLLDRKSGDVLAESRIVNGRHGLFMVPEAGALVSVSFEGGDMTVPYHIGLLYSAPEDAGVPTVDAATKAFAEAMKRKPKMEPLPDGFSLIKPKDEDDEG